MVATVQKQSLSELCSGVKEETVNSFPESQGDFTEEITLTVLKLDNPQETENRAREGSPEKQHSTSNSLGILRELPVV